MRRVVLSVLGGLMTISCDGFMDSYEDKVARGRSVFEAECASCHGPKGGGTSWGGDLRSKLEGRYSFAKFSSIVMSGRRRRTADGEYKVMPRFADRPLVARNLGEIYFYLNEEAWPPDGD